MKPFLIDKFQYGCIPENFADYQLDKLTKDGQSALIYAIINLRLTDNQWDYLIRNSNLDNFDVQDSNALMYILINNNRYGFDFTKYLPFLIENTDFNIHENKYTENALTYLLHSCKEEGGTTIAPIFWHKIVNKIINEKNAGKDILLYTFNLMEHNLLFKNETENELNKIWPYIEDKNWFISYIKENKFDLLYDNELIYAYIEKNNLSSIIVESIDNKSNILKI